MQKTGFYGMNIIQMKFLLEKQYTVTKSMQ